MKIPLFHKPPRLKAIAAAALFMAGPVLAESPPEPIQGDMSISGVSAADNLNYWSWIGFYDNAPKDFYGKAFRVGQHWVSKAPGEIAEWETELVAGERTPLFEGFKVVESGLRGSEGQANSFEISNGETKTVSTTISFGVDLDPLYFREVFSGFGTVSASVERLNEISYTTSLTRVYSCSGQPGKEVYPYERLNYALGSRSPPL